MRLMSTALTVSQSGIIWYRAHCPQGEAPSTPEERTQHALRLAQRALAEAQEMSDHVQQLPSARASPRVPLIYAISTVHGIARCT